MSSSTKVNGPVLINPHDIIGMMITVAVDLRRRARDRTFHRELMGTTLPLTPGRRQEYVEHIEAMKLSDALTEQEARNMKNLVEGYHHLTADVQALIHRIFDETTYQRLMTFERQWEVVAQRRRNLYQRLYEQLFVQLPAPQTETLAASVKK